MTSIEEFKCVFCQESFGNKEELQIHFRKHGDPSFNTTQKNKTRPQLNHLQQLDEQKNEDVEKVSCDVCTEVFPTISKAITHKHKVHPDHDAKYFCPWCGKLFTMKHLYNKHLQCNHDDMERKNDVNFHCDVCNVDFYIAAAMLYHNKFFHRQDTDLFIIGQSKKLRKINQEFLQIYYCAFCGDEYDNRVNIHKHMTEEHNDENQSPEDILRCPLCDAIFYHLDAYEIHLTFHSTEDLYSEKNEMFDQITDFSLETVAPLIEKVENVEDVEQTLNAVGIEKFLEMAMDNSGDNDLPKKSKKRKKHKKSKKSAITLDEFLNMNKDVFGEGIDIQGVEEVPTQMIKRLNTRKVGRPPKKTNEDLEKLKKHGIVVKMKPTKKTPIQNLKSKNKLGEPEINVPKTSVINNHTTETKTPNDVISKLMNQSNNQIKIVKKNSRDDLNIDQQTKIHLSQSSSGNSPENTLKDIPITTSTHISSEKEKIDEFPEASATQEYTPVELKLKNDEKQQVKHILLSDKKSVSDNTDVLNSSNTLIDEKMAASKKVDDTIAHNSMSDEYDSDPNHPHNSDEEGHTPKNELPDQESQPNIIENDSKNNSLAALKHLSHLITIKPVSPKVPSPVDSTKHNNNEHKITKTVCHQPESSQKNITQKLGHLLSSKEEINKGSTSVNKNVSVKPLAHSPTIYDKHNLTDAEKSGTDAGKTVSPFIQKQLNMQSKNIKTEQSYANIVKEESQNTNVNILQRLTNITAKPINTIKNNQQKLVKNMQYMVNKKPFLNKIQGTQLNIEQNIEIFNIDDSDSDETDNILAPSKTSNALVTTASNQSLAKLQGLNKNITIKTTNKEATVINKNKPTIKDIDNRSECAVSDFSDEDEDYNTVESNLTLSPQTKIQNTLKNLSKHITVKSGNISPNVSMKVSKNIPTQNEKFNSYEDSDDDSLPAGVNITELNEDHFSEDETSQFNDRNNEYDSNVIVQSPGESNDEDDNDNTNGELLDLEGQLKTNTIMRPVQKKPPLEEKQKNKNVTIKKMSKEQSPVATSCKTSNILPTNKELSIKPFKQVKHESGEQPSVSNKTDTGQAKNQLINHDETSNNQIDAVNKEVMVKTFQTQTVIQEITTTVTKTIKTVNQTVKQQLQTINSQPLRFQKVQGMTPSNCGKGVAFRQKAPTTGTKVRGLMPSRLPQANTLRPCNQLVPVRPSMSRTPGPRMPTVKKIGSVPSQPSPVENKPLKMSPSAIVAKRPPEETFGHFSCFKKPKESLIPQMDDDNNYDSTNNYTASQSTSNFCNITKTAKGNSVVTLTQMKSEASCSSQELNKLNNISGLKIVKTSQSKQCVQVEEKCELSASKRNTLEAIEKLQKQGLLIKKPRIELPNENDLYEEDEYDSN
ncbi:hypothetical protein ACJJTC_015340 [Scirpophaga incertulas]